MPHPTHMTFMTHISDPWLWLPLSFWFALGAGCLWLELRARRTGRPATHHTTRRRLPGRRTIN